MNYQIDISVNRWLIIGSGFIAMAALLFGIDFYFYEGYEEIRMMCTSVAILSLTPTVVSKGFWECLGISFIFTSLYTLLVFLTVEMQMAERFLALCSL